MSRRRRLNVMLVALLGLFGAALVSRISPTPVVSQRIFPSEFDRPLPGDVKLRRGWRGVVATSVPRPLHSILADARFVKGLVLGTRESGGVYTYRHLGVAKPLVEDLSDEGAFGSVEVNGLHVTNLDGAGPAELVAAVSQVSTRQSPRFYVWTLENRPILRGMARPGIESSWVHGLASVAVPGRRERALLSSFCGFGEVVELRFEDRRSPEGLALEGLSWRKAADFPLSGESLGIADVTRDGRASPQLCLALGFSEGNAQIRVYRPRPAGRGAETPDVIRAAGWEWYLHQTIEEAGRFANVRMLLEDTDGDGFKEMHAWWVEGLQGGRCELIRYDLAEYGVERRLIHATEDPDFWPLETQITHGDSDGDGRPEIWFASGTNLWRLDESKAHVPEVIATSADHFGPVAINSFGVYVGRGNQLLRLEPTERAGSGRTPGRNPDLATSGAATSDRPLPPDRHGG